MIAERVAAAHCGVWRAFSLSSFITYCDGSSRARPGGRGTTRGTSADRISVRCVLSGRPGVDSAQVERLARPSGSLLIRGFRVRAPGAPPAKTSLVHLVSWDECLVPRNTACLACGRGIRSRKVTASPSQWNQIADSGAGLVPIPLGAGRGQNTRFGSSGPSGQVAGN
jgi:hypothetical protein